MGVRRTWTGRSWRPGGPSRPIRQTAPAERIALFDRIIAAYEARVDDLAEVMAREIGAPKSAAVQVKGPIDQFKQATQPALVVSLRDPHRRQHHSQGAHRRLRSDLALELADPDSRHEDRLRAGRRMHDGLEAKRGFADELDHPGRDPGCGGRSEGGVQPGDRRRPVGRGGDLPPSRTWTWSPSPGRPGQVFW